MVGVSLLVVADTVITQSESSHFSFESSLLDSVKNNDLNLLLFLLSINTNPNAADKNNKTALYIASELNQEIFVVLLLKANANPIVKDDEGRTPLYIASREGTYQNSLLFSYKRMLILIFLEMMVAHLSTLLVRMVTLT